MLVANQLKGRHPDLSQDDGSLVKEFGEPPVRVKEPEEDAKVKKKKGQ